MDKVKASVRLAVMAEIRRAEARARDISEFESHWVGYFVRKARLWGVL
jgi:hypothetical protein